MARCHNSTMLATSFLIYITRIDPTKANKCTHEFQLEASIRKGSRQIEKVQLQELLLLVPKIDSAKMHAIVKPLL